MRKFLFASLALTLSASAVAATVQGVIYIGNPKHPDESVIAVVAGSSSENPSAVHEWWDCNVGWAEIEFGSTYSCNLDSPGGWCRDAFLATDPNAEGLGACYINPPGPSYYTIALDFE